MKPNYTDITLILDRSGSMSSIVDATLDGLNSFVADQQRLPGEVRFTLVHFNTRRFVHFTAAPIREVPRFDRDDYKPHGRTALLDAVGLTIDETGRRLEAQPEGDRPSKVIIAILSDGLENASRRFSYAQVAEQIAHQESVYRWDFLFLGANQDAIAEAAKLRIAAKSALTFLASVASSGEAFKALSKSVSDAHSGKNQKAGFEETDRAAQEPGRDAGTGSTKGEQR